MTEAELPSLPPTANGSSELTLRAMWSHASKTLSDHFGLGGACQGVMCGGASSRGEHEAGGGKLEGANEVKIIEEVDGSGSGVHGYPDGRMLPEIAHTRLHTAFTEAQRVRAIHEYYVMAASNAAWMDMEPLGWLLIGIGFFLKIYAFIDMVFRPYTQLSILIISVRQVLQGELMLFMTLFLFFISTVIVTMVTIYPDHRAREDLPQAADFFHPLQASMAVLIAGFTGEPLELNMNPELLEPLGLWQKVGMFFFFVTYVMFIFLSLILLLNLLIALLGSTFVKTQEQATQQGRIQLARIVLRLELVADFIGVDTHAGEHSGDDGEYVHKFRSTMRDMNGEVPRDHVDENIFGVESPRDGQRSVEEAVAAAEAKRVTQLIQHELKSHGLVRQGKLPTHPRTAWAGSQGCGGERTTGRGDRGGNSPNGKCGGGGGGGGSGSGGFNERRLPVLK